MGANTEIIHTKHGLIKVIDDEGTMRIRLCPRFDQTGMDRSIPEYDEVHGAVETQLDWREVNLLIHRLRLIRDRTFGRAE